MNVWELLLEQIQAQHPAEWGAVVGAVLYLVLAARENPWCWVWGILSCICWAYAAFALYGLYIDGFLQVFYIVISGLGLYRWLYGGKEHKGISITTISGSMHLIIVVGGVLLSIAVGYLFDQYTEAQATYLDALTTVFSVIITFMVIGKKLENWIYWLVIDSIYVYLYWSRGGYLIALLFIVYLVIVVFGFLNWWKEWKVLNSRKPS
jgi:nicotinamide mononucleotide transporter